MVAVDYAAMRTDRAPLFVFVFIFVALLLVIAIGSRADADLWGHIRFGEDILASHQIASRDPYSFTSDQAWTNHEWLAEVLMAFAYERGGVAGLLLLSVGAGLASLLIAGRFLSRAGVGDPVVVVLLLLLWCGLWYQLAVIRPQLFSTVLFVVLLTVLWNAEHRDPRRLLAVVPLFAVWANLHGGWIVGLGVVGLWAVSAAVTRRVPLRWCGAAIMGALCGSLATPYGWRLWEFLWNTVGLGRADIEDWQPIFKSPDHVVLWLAALAIAVAGWWRRRAVPLHRVLPVLALAAMSLKVVRLDTSFVIVSVMVMGPLLAGLGPSRFPLSRRPSRGELMAVSVVGAFGLGVSMWFAGGTVRCLPIEAGRVYAPEAEAVLFAKRNHLGGRMLTWFDYGEYAIWHLSPQLKVSYDGRRETVYSERVRDYHQRFYFGQDPGYARRIGADYVWLPRQLPVVKQLPREGWVPIFTGPRSVIFARTAGHYVAVAPLQGPRCFPGP